MCRHLLHFYTLTMKLSEMEINNPNYHSSKRIKYLEINLPKEIKYLYLENYETDERN